VPRRSGAASSRRGGTARGRALAELGFPPAPILPGPKREPSWPPGAVGSITHCRDYCAAAVAPASRFASIGIDAEVHDELPEGVLERISLPEERAWLETRLGDGTCWDTVVFSAKECVFKAWFPVARRWLGFEDACVELAPDEGTFHARVLVPAPLTGFDGRYLVRDGLVVTAIALPSDSVRVWDDG
jgi:4'-phosphopantetheinyl transferase EntD